MTAENAGEIVGIDLGTTNSLIGTVEAGFPILLADPEGSRLTPSAVHYPPDGGPPVTGAAALRRRTTHPSRTILSVKRLIGRRPGEMDHAPPYPLATDSAGRQGIAIDGRVISPVEVSAEILRRLKRIAEDRLERPVRRAVITVPAYFNDAQRVATRQAGELAGFTVERILNEPTAAALAFGLDKAPGRSRIAVYDLGGGTFDISILELTDGVFEVLSTRGDTQLGGDDLDRALAAWIWSRAAPDATDPPPPDTAARISEAAVAAKHALSTADSAEVAIPFLHDGRSFSTTIPRATAESLFRPVLERTRSHCLHALADAGLTAADIDTVLLVGGSTRIPLVREIARDIFGRDPDTSRNPDETVALGAVIQAGVLSGALRKVVLLDVTPLSLGIETFGGLMNVILPRNTTIPARAGEMFTNAVAGQRSMRIRILQGEREMARDNWELGQFEIEFAPGPKGSARVGIQFEIDADGILRVLARDTLTQTDRVLTIDRTAVDVEDEKVAAMIAESVDFAFEDMNERIFTEASLKSQELLSATGDALAKAGDLLPEEDRRRIAAAAAAVREALASGDPRRLKSANSDLDAATEPLATLLIDLAMQAALERRLGPES